MKNNQSWWHFIFQCKAFCKECFFYCIDKYVLNDIKNILKTALCHFTLWRLLRFSAQNRKLLTIFLLKEDTMNRGGKFSVLSSNISTLEAEECASEMSSLAQWKSTGWIQRQEYVEWESVRAGNDDPPTHRTDFHA